MAVNNDRSLEHGDDARIAALYRGAAHDRPPPYVDAAVMKTARVLASEVPKPRTARWRAWRVPLATAVLAVLSASVVLLMTQVARERVSADSSERTTPDQPSAASEKQTDVEKRVVQPSGEKSRRAGDEPPTTGQARTAAAPLQPPKTAVGTVDQDAAARRAPPHPRSETINASPDRLNEAAQQQSAAPSAPTASQQSPPQAAPAARARTAQPERAARALQPSAADARIADDLAKLEGEPPERWIERIAELKRDGNDTQADLLISEFKRRFGERALP